MTVYASIVVIYFCIAGVVLPAIQQTWEVGMNGMNGMKKLHLVTTDKGNAIIGDQGEVLAYLAKDEIVDGIVVSKSKETVLLKLDYRKVWKGGGGTGQWYSRLLWIRTVRVGSFARSVLPYTCDFLYKQKMSIRSVSSVSDDGSAVNVVINVNINGYSEQEVRTIEPFEPRFIDPK